MFHCLFESLTTGGCEIPAKPVTWLQCRVLRCGRPLHLQQNQTKRKFQGACFESKWYGELLKSLDLKLQESVLEFVIFVKAKKLNISGHLSGGLNLLPYLLSTSVSLAVIKDFSTNYMLALGLNQAYTIYIAKIK